MKKLKFIWTLILLVIPLSCHQETNTEQVVMCDQQIMNAKIPASQVPFYASLEKFNLIDKPALTKADDNEVTVELESLIDRSRSTSYVIRGVHYIQTPFFQNRDEIYSALHHERAVSPDSVTLLKKFLIETESTVLQEDKSYIATMIPDKRYFESRFGLEYDFIDMRNFTGLILFSEVDGTLLTSQYYMNGKIAYAGLLLPEKLAEVNNIEYFSLLSSVETKGGDEIIADSEEICIGYSTEPLIPIISPSGQENIWNLGWIAGSTIIAYRSNNMGGWIDPSLVIGFTGGNVGAGTGNGLGNGLNAPAYTQGMTGDDVLLPLGPVYGVILDTNKPEEIRMQGTGVYSYKAIVPVDIQYTMQVGGMLTNADNYHFTQWIGDLSDRDDYRLLLTVDKDYYSVACFDIEAPCVDTTKGVSNPLVDMKVAATKSGRHKNGLFGDYRGRQHDGIDLKANVGMPCFSLYNGVVVAVNETYEDRYYAHSYGNRIVIKSHVNGKDIDIWYTHLQSGNAININPRTLKKFKVGDYVFRGELIGYTGRSGNAYDDEDVPNKHLHLGIKIEETWVDPILYLNGEIDLDTIEESNGEIINIKCD